MSGISDISRKGINFPIIYQRTLEREKRLLLDFKENADFRGRCVSLAGLERMFASNLLKKKILSANRIFEDLMNTGKKVIKIILSGEGGVGKSTLLLRYLDGKFNSRTGMNPGFGLYEEDAIINDEEYKIIYIDLAGQYPFRFLYEL